MDNRDHTEIDIDPAFGNWLAGFLDGEGCFVIYKQPGHSYSCRISVNLRADDRGILEEIVGRTGCGKVFERKAYKTPGITGRKPQVVWATHSRADAVRMMSLLDRHPLRAKKARDYGIWRLAVLEWCRLAGKRRADWSRVIELQAAMSAGRSYDGAPEPLAEAEDPQLVMKAVGE